MTDQEDYKLFLDEYGLTEDYVQSLVKNKIDRLEEYHPPTLIEISKSSINGKGVIALQAFKDGDIIGLSRIDGKRTLLGIYTNHAKIPNAKFNSLENGNLELVATQYINPFYEITIDYRHSLNIGGSGIKKVFNFPFLTHEMDLSTYNNRQKIEIIEWIILNKMDNIADDLPVKHNVHGGIYERSLFIPKGVVLTGKIHVENHICELSEGDLSVMTDEGVKRIQAPARFNTKAGLKKIGYAHENCVFTTYHSTNLTDIAAIEKELFSDGDISWVGELMQKQELLEAA